MAQHVVEGVYPALDRCWAGVTGERVDTFAYC